jgi:hypothetical protein
VIRTGFGILFFGADGLPGTPPPLPLLARDVEGSRCPGDPGNSGALTNLNLEMNLYGPGKVEVRIVHHQVRNDDPTYIWSGSPLANWALTLRHKRNHVDLNGRWRTSKAGFHLLRPVVQLADGALLAEITSKAQAGLAGNRFAVAECAGGH